MNLTKVFFPVVMLVASTAFVRATTIVVPVGLENVEGDEALAAPFTAPSDARTQSLYDASNFSGPTIISQIAYRLDGGSGSVDFTITDIQINFSTFTGAALNTTFAENIGSDETVVFNRGSLPVVMNAGGSPNAFDLVINLDTTFAFDPAAGGLLIDIVKYSGEYRTVNFDAKSTSAVTTIGSNNVGSSREFSLNKVFVTQFTVVPEPNSTSILLFGFVSLVCCSRRAHA